MNLLFLDLLLNPLGYHILIAHFLQLFLELPSFLQSKNVFFVLSQPYLFRSVWYLGFDEPLHLVHVFIIIFLQVQSYLFFL